MERTDIVIAGAGPVGLALAAAIGHAAAGIGVVLREPVINLVGLQRARSRTWERTAAATERLYGELIT